MDGDVNFGSFLLWAFCWATPAATILAAVFSAGHRTGTGNLWYFVVFVVVPPAIVTVARRAEQRTGRQVLWKVGVPLALVACGGILAWAATAPATLTKRCVDVRTMTVAASHDCQSLVDVTTYGYPGRFRWYYGGSGTEEDQPVKGGSFNAPAEEAPPGRSGVGGEGDEG